MLNKSITPPSSTGVKVEKKPEYKFSCSQMTAVILGGISEFVVSICLILSFHVSLAHNINQGISTSIMVFNDITVTILSYLILKESVSVLQIFGIVCIVVGISLISVFGPKQLTPIEYFHENPEEEFY